MLSVEKVKHTCLITWPWKLPFCCVILTRTCFVFFQTTARLILIYYYSRQCQMYLIVFSRLYFDPLFNVSASDPIIVYVQASPRAASRGKVCTPFVFIYLLGLVIVTLCKIWRIEKQISTSIIWRSYNKKKIVHQFYYYHRFYNVLPLFVSIRCFCQTNLVCQNVLYSWMEGVNVDCFYKYLIKFYNIWLWLNSK